MPLLEIGILLALVVINGVFAMSELAVVSSRRSKLKALMDEGRAGASSALALASEPGRFLSTVQIGITLVGVLVGAVSGARFGERLATWLTDLGVSYALAEAIGFGIVIALITYLSLVIGELVPKQLALRNPETVAMTIAPMMQLLSRLAAPFVWGLDMSGRLVLRLLHAPESDEAEVTAEEIKALVAEAETSGAIEPEERQMIGGILRLGERSARAVMTHRNAVEIIDATMPVEEVRQKMLLSVHGRFPAHLGNPDEITRVIQTKDVLKALLSNKPIDLPALAREAPIVPDTSDLLRVVKVLRESAVHMGLVHDEYGQFQGIVTNADILESITGAFHTDEGAPEPKAVERADGSWLISGDMPVDELSDTLGTRVKFDARAHTVAGFVIAAFKRLPMVGECVVIQGWRFEVVDLDGRRVDKLLVARAREPRRRKTG
jgi:putative hemolysin